MTSTGGKLFAGTLPGELADDCVPDTFPGELLDDRIPAIILLSIIILPTDSCGPLRKSEKLRDWLK
jgi:hypothetical protein